MPNAGCQRARDLIKGFKWHIKGQCTLMNDVSQFMIVSIVHMRICNAWLCATHATNGHSPCCMAYGQPVRSRAGSYVWSINKYMMYESNCAHPFTQGPPKINIK